MYSEFAPIPGILGSPKLFLIENAGFFERHPTRGAFFLRRNAMKDGWPGPNPTDRPKQRSVEKEKGLCRSPELNKYRQRFDTELSEIPLDPGGSQGHRGTDVDPCSKTNR